MSFCLASAWLYNVSSRTHVLSTNTDVTLWCGVQQRQIDNGLLRAGATKNEQQAADTLLTQALVTKNIPMAFVNSPHLKAYVTLISGGRYKTPSIHTVVQRLGELQDRIHSKVAAMLKKQAYIAFETDSWSRAGKHFTAVTTGPPGLTVLTAAYENAASDNAVNTADALHR